MKKTVSVILALSVIMGLFLCFPTAGAQTLDKDKIKPGDVVDAVKYDVASGTYTYGTISIKSHTPEGVSTAYNVLDENNFKASEGTVSDTIKNKISMIEQSTNTVFENRKNEVNLGKFGRVDSESWKYSVAIAPYVIPMLETQDFSRDENIWMAYGNGKGTVLKVWITVNTADTAPTGEKINVGVVTPKKMSIRLQDGSILKTGDSFDIAAGQTIKFQMCSNNWDNDIYDDNGNGLAGTVVYSVSVSSRYDERSYDPDSKTFILPKGDPVLRTDVNSCFMAYKYHFRKGDYNKQTGISNVVNTPLESLSVNLPLGSTITSDAYKAFNQVDTARVFIETGEDKTLSYTDYYWEY